MDLIEVGVCYDTQEWPQTGCPATTRSIEFFWCWALVLHTATRFCRGTESPRHRLPWSVSCLS
jgi:hypothetical protein